MILYNHPGKRPVGNKKCIGAFNVCDEVWEHRNGITYRLVSPPTLLLTSLWCDLDSPSFTVVGCNILNALLFTGVDVRLIQLVPVLHLIQFGPLEAHFQTIDRLVQFPVFDKLIEEGENVML